MKLTAHDGKNRQWLGTLIEEDVILEAMVPRDGHLGFWGRQRSRASMDRTLAVAKLHGGPGGILAVALGSHAAVVPTAKEGTLPKGSYASLTSEPPDARRPD